MTEKPLGVGQRSIFCHASSGGVCEMFGWCLGPRTEDTSTACKGMGAGGGIPRLLSSLRLRIGQTPRVSPLWGRGPWARPPAEQTHGTARAVGALLCPAVLKAGASLQPEPWQLGGELRTVL